MNVTVNGQGLEVDSGMTLEAMARDIGLDPAAVAALRNDDIVARDAFADTVIEEGDTIELVGFVPGG